MRNFRSNIFLGILFTITLAYPMEKKELSYTVQCARACTIDVKICNDLRKNLEPDLLRKLEKNSQEDIRNFDIESSPHAYTLKLFAAALSVLDSEVLHSIITARPITFKANILSDSDDLKGIVHDLIKKRSFESLQLLLSLPLYKSRDEWEKFYKDGIELAVKEKSNKAKKLFLNAKNEVSVTNT